MRLSLKLVRNLMTFVSFLVICYLSFINGDFSNYFPSSRFSQRNLYNDTDMVSSTVGLDLVLDVEHAQIAQFNDVWFIFTKVKSLNEPLAVKLHNFMHSLLHFCTSTQSLRLHIISDVNSKFIAQTLLDDALKVANKSLSIEFYNSSEISRKIQGIVDAMRPHFSSQPDSYYSDALFFISLGLHLVAPTTINRAAMFDVDMEFRSDIVNLFQEFDRFGPQALFGLAPELTPVYRHILYRYRNLHKDTLFGKSLIEGGYPGLNSGVILFRLDRIRQSDVYNMLLQKNSSDFLANKYNFKALCLCTRMRFSNIDPDLRIKRKAMPHFKPQVLSAEFLPYPNPPPPRRPFWTGTDRESLATANGVNT
ncbi:xyloside xylosyltransferase 1 isoform X3 [Bemisia tabaci]|uniref:xyloside xylosyltransferase 1 isoform X3 n=1 Tax=Bemisia tabaci TaxID=7038 RepID=UPI003B27C8CD